MKYMKYYKALPIVSNRILLEAQHGHEIDGNIYYILKEILTDSRYAEYEVYLCADSETNKNVFLRKIEEFIGSNLKVVIRDTKEYYKIIASAKYLINDTTFSPFFIKKNGQKYVNVWHGTPLKTLGRKVLSEPHAIGNVQKNFNVADYLLYPNEYTEKHMIEDYMLSNTSKAKILLGGYPRNIAFFDEKRKQRIIEEEGVKGKRVYVYMPTWRGTVNDVDNKDNTTLQNYLCELDKKLCEDEIIFVKLHPMDIKLINFENFTHIYAYPSKYETYEFLNIAECLITDYSSVLYDFAITSKKVVLFIYDEEEYLESRGLYEPLNKLPFEKTKNIDELLHAIRREKQYDDSDFIKKYCSYESASAAKNLCEHTILGKAVLIEKCMPCNGKENILLYAGNLAQNGITTSLMNLLNNVDTDKHNYFITFKGRAVAPNKEILFTLPQNVNYIACSGKMNLSILKKIVHVLYGQRLLPFCLYWKIVQGDFGYENKRLYDDISFKAVIHFNGYEYKKILAFSQFRCNRIIYVHSDMLQEILTKNNQRRKVLEYAYRVYDSVAIVTEDIRESTCKISGTYRNIRLSHNIIPHEHIKEKSMQTLCFDKDTECNIDFEELQLILKRRDRHFFINVGRYAVEKGQKRLINAFNRIWHEDQSAYLIIVGGYELQNVREYLLEYINTLECRKHIVLIKAMKNPFPLIKACNSFILSSFYEGFGLVLAEANILGLPIVSTDITGPRGFMRKYGGFLVENTEHGIYEGMKHLLNHQIDTIDVDYEDYNKTAIREFETLINL